LIKDRDVGESAYLPPEHVDSCPLCSHSTAREIATYAYYTGEGSLSVTLVRCRQCGLLFLSRGPTADSLRGHMERASYTNQEKSSSSLIARRQLFEGILKLANQWKPEKGRCLDVGCGHGDLLSLAREQGWDVYGTEILERLCHQVQARGIACVCNASLEGLPQQSFDCLTFIDSLYYMPEPLGELRHAYRLLRDGGIVILRVTNRAAWATILAPVRHVFPSPFRRIVGDALVHFSPITTRAILLQAGFSRVQLLPDPRRRNSWPPSLTLIAYGLGRITWHITNGRILISPGLVAIARRDG